MCHENGMHVVFRSRLREDFHLAEIDVLDAPVVPDPQGCHVGARFVEHLLRLDTARAVAVVKLPSVRDNLRVKRQ